MTKQRWLIGAGTMLLLASLWFADPFSYMLWTVYWHGPPALERLPVSEPAATLHYGPAAQQVEELRLPVGPGPFPIAIVVHGGC